MRKLKRSERPKKVKDQPAQVYPVFLTFDNIRTINSLLLITAHEDRMAHLEEDRDPFLQNAQSEFEKEYAKVKAKTGHW